ncbi:hypothetical protein ACOMHN_029863 [Nucella lapillus]
MAMHTKVRDPMVMHTKIRDPMTMGTKVRETMAMRTKVRDPMAMGTKVRDPMAMRTKVRDPMAMHTKVREPMAMRTKVMEPMAMHTKVRDPMAMHTKGREPMAMHTKGREPMAMRTKVREPIAMHTKGLKWTNVPDDVMYACAGSILTFPWQFKVSDAENVVNVDWTFDGALVSNPVATLASGYFVPTQGYTARARHVRHGGLVLGPVTGADSGNYTVSVNTETQGQLRTFQNTVYLQVADGAMLSGGHMRVGQDPEAQWNNASQHWMLRLTCGMFTFTGPPPLNVIWTTPAGDLVGSTDYQSGIFHLALTTPVAGGNYTCTVPPAQLPTLCATASNPHDFSASLVVDETKARLSLLEANQKMLRDENVQLRANQKTLREENVQLRANQTTLLTESQQLRTNQTTLLRESQQLRANQTTLLRESQQLQANQTTLLRESQQLRANQTTLQQGADQLTERLQDLQQTHQRDVSNISDYCQEVKHNLTEQMDLLQLSLVDRIHIESNLSQLVDLTGPCHPVNYTIIDDPRRVVAGRYTGSDDMCDKGLIAGWYRFLLNGDNAQIPSACVPDNHCNTDAPTWMDLQGQAMPTAGQQVEARACSHWSSNCCKWNVPLTVRNCGDFYVYRLRPVTTCDLAFCVEPQG